MQVSPNNGTTKVCRRPEFTFDFSETILLNRDSMVMVYDCGWQENSGSTTRNSNIKIADERVKGDTMRYLDATHSSLGLELTGRRD